MTPLLLASCIDSQLGAAGEGESREMPGHDTVYPSDSAGDSGDSSDATAECRAAPEGAVAAAPTCTALPEVAWDMVLEADIQNEVDPANWAYIGAPVVAPLVANAPTLVPYPSWVAAGSGSVVAIDPLAGAVAWRLDNLGNDADHLAVSRDAVAGGGGIGRMAVPTASVRLQCGDLNGGRSTIPNDGATLIGIVDTTHDGVAEFVYDHLVLDAGCVELFDAPMLVRVVLHLPSRPRQRRRRASCCPYDVTTVRDDGSIVAFPRPNWQTYNSFRAQPAHDGDRPDLTIEVTEVCADVCGPGGIVEVAVQASNLGSREAGPGAEIRLYTCSEADGAVLVAQRTLTDAIPPTWSAEGVVFDVPWEDWRDGRFVEIEGVGSDECDLVNDRIDIFEAPCADASP